MDHGSIDQDYYKFLDVHHLTGTMLVHSLAQCLLQSYHTADITRLTLFSKIHYTWMFELSCEIDFTCWITSMLWRRLLHWGMHYRAA